MVSTRDNYLPKLRHWFCTIVGFLAAWHCPNARIAAQVKKDVEFVQKEAVINPYPSEIRRHTALTDVVIKQTGVSYKFGVRPDQGGDFQVAVSADIIGDLPKVLRPGDEFSVTVRGTARILEKYPGTTELRFVPFSAAHLFVLQSVAPKPAAAQKKGPPDGSAGRWGGWDDPEHGWVESFQRKYTWKVPQTAQSFAPGSRAYFTVLFKIGGDNALRIPELTVLRYQYEYGCTTRTLSGRVFEDRNNNGVHDADEPWLPGWTVRLTYADGVQRDETTDSEGRYTFNQLIPGTYQLNLVEKAGYRISAPTLATQQQREPARTFTRNMQTSLGSQVEFLALLKSIGYTEGDPRSPPPCGSAMMWRQGESFSVHSSMALGDGRQLEMGHHPWPNKAGEYASAILSSPTPDAGGRPYRLYAYWSPSPSSQPDLVRLTSDAPPTGEPAPGSGMVGIRRHWGEGSAQNPATWMCHGFAYYLAYTCVKTRTHRVELNNTDVEGLLFGVNRSERKLLVNIQVAGKSGDVPLLFGESDQALVRVQESITENGKQKIISPVEMGPVRVQIFLDNAKIAEGTTDALGAMESPLSFSTMPAMGRTKATLKAVAFKPGVKFAEASQLIEVWRGLRGLTVSATVSNSSPKLGEKVVVSGTVAERGYLLFAPPVDAEITLSNSFGTELSKADSTAGGRFSFTVPIQDATSYLTLWITARPKNRARFADGTATVRLRPLQEGDLSVSLMTDKGVYKDDETVSINGFVRDGKDTPISATVQLLLNGGEIAVLTAGRDGRFRHSFVPADAPRPKGQIWVSGPHQISAVAEKIGYPRTIPAGAFIYVVPAGTRGGTLGTVTVTEVEGRPSAVPPPGFGQVPSSSSITLAPSTKLTPGFTIKTREEEQIRSEFPVGGGRTAQLTIGPNSTLKIDRYEISPGGDVKVRILVTNPSHVEISIKGPTNLQQHQFELMTPNLLVTPVNTRYLVLVGKDGATTVAALEGTVRVTDHARLTELRIDQGKEVVVPVTGKLGGQNVRARTVRSDRR